MLRFLFLSFPVPPSFFARPRETPMNHSTRTRFVAWCACALSLLALGSGCLGTPLPDPPSFSGEAITLSESPQPDTVRLVGDPHALNPGGVTLRITTPPAPGELVATNADGSFGRIVPGAAGDRIFFEIIDTEEDRFVGAFMAPLGGRLVAVDPGPDTDADGSPDAIDCAPTDDTVGGQRCAPSCAADSDCGAGEVCSGGVCVVGTVCRADTDCGPAGTCVSGLCSGGPVACTPVPETCNGIDDDCDGAIDDGEPGSGVACTTAGMCPGVEVCMMVEPLTCDPRPLGAEICGNGIDDDCDGVIDGC
jgi:hypothetical protein